MHINCKDILLCLLFSNIALKYHLHSIIGHATTKVERQTLQKSIIPPTVFDLRACLHQCVRAYERACMRACVHACVHACVCACVRASVRACVRASARA